MDLFKQISKNDFNRIKNGYSYIEKYEDKPVTFYVHTTDEAEHSENPYKLSFYIPSVMNCQRHITMTNFEEVNELLIKGRIAVKMAEIPSDNKKEYYKLIIETYDLKETTTKHNFKNNNNLPYFRLKKESNGKYKLRVRDYSQDKKEIHEGVFKKGLFTKKQAEKIINDTQNFFDNHGYYLRDRDGRIKTFLYHEEAAYLNRKTDNVKHTIPDVLFKEPINKSRIQKSSNYDVVSKLKKEVQKLKDENTNLKEWNNLLKKHVTLLEKQVELI